MNFIFTFFLIILMAFEVSAKKISDNTLLSTFSFPGHQPATKLEGSENPQSGKIRPSGFPHAD